jgi:putative glutamine amidotransferase
LSRAVPLIAIAGHPAAISWGTWHDIPATFVTATYTRAIEAAGGAAIVVPPAEIHAERPELVLRSVDGLLLAGGEDVEPSLYGAERDPRTGPAAELRDRTELALLGQAIRDGIPVLAICRGCQLLNVIQGGTLQQDLSDTTQVELHRVRPGVFAEHGVSTDGGALAEMLGRATRVKSHHHQGIGDIGRDLACTARADDGGVEGIELATHPFCVGVLWHPEESTDHSMADLFGRFVSESALARARKLDGALALGSPHP